MATSENIESRYSEVDQVVTRWIVDYYLSYGFTLFQKERDKDLRGISNLLSSIPDYPLEASDSIQKKCRLLQFLSRISEGESLGISFDVDSLLSPLESALSVLDLINQEFSIPSQDFEDISTSLKEMIVVIFIKNNEFHKAKEALTKLFPKAMVGKKVIFMGLIKQKSKAHNVIEQSDFKQFKEKMLEFCQRLCPLKTPFLNRAAEVLIQKRQMVVDDEIPDSPDEQGVSSLTDSPSLLRNHNQSGLGKLKILSKARLEQAYAALSAGTSNMTFAQLEEEMERQTQDQVASSTLSPLPTTSRDVEQTQVFQRDSGSPMEATPADQPPQTEADLQTQAGSHSESPVVRRSRRNFTLARLVMEPDSQPSSQCTPTSQEEEVEERTEESSAHSPAETARRDSEMNNGVFEPTQKRPRPASNTSRNSAQSSENEEDSHSSGTEKRTPLRISKRLSSSSHRCRMRISSDSDLESPSSYKPPSRDSGSVAANSVSDSLPDASSSAKTSSTPGKDSTSQKPVSKWKSLFHNAKESKESWNDEDLYFVSKTDSHNTSSSSHSGHRRLMWTEEESQKLKDGVKRFGEGNWSQIKSYYNFKDRSNVNLKDRWRTMKKQGLT